MSEEHLQAEYTWSARKCACDVHGLGWMLDVAWDEYGSTSLLAHRSNCLLHGGASRTEAVQSLCNSPYVDSQRSWRESTWQDIENSLMSMQRTLPLNGLRPR